MDRTENPNPALWRASPTSQVSINLARVVATAARDVNGEIKFCVLFDCQVVSGPRVAVIDAFLPVPLTDEQIRDFMTALEIYHSKR